MVGMQAEHARRAWNQGSVLDCGSLLPLSAPQPAAARGLKQASFGSFDFHLSPASRAGRLKAAAGCRSPK
jgi:hypothetical protein